MKTVFLILIILGIALGALAWLSRERQATPVARRRYRVAPAEAASRLLPLEQAGDDRPSMTEPGARSAMEVDDAHAFYFRGSDGHLNLAARSIETFMDIAKDVEEDVWLYHLARGDCARWFREVMGDERLATEADRLAHELCSASESRKLLQGARSD